MADKIVNYNKYCPHCANKNVPEAADPCDGCLAVPSRVDTAVPSNFKWDEIGENPIQKTGSSVDFSLWKG